MPFATACVSDGEGGKDRGGKDRGGKEGRGRGEEGKEGTDYMRLVSE